MFTSEEVKAILRTLPVGKAVGPDGISNRILRELANSTSTIPPLERNGLVYSDEVEKANIIHHLLPYLISPYTKEMFQCALK